MKKKSKGTRTGEHQGQSHSYTESHRERKKARYTEIEKDKSREAKDSQDNLRIAGKKQAKLRPGIHN